jgi:hypothetical protein
MAKTKKLAQNKRLNMDLTPADWEVLLRLQKDLTPKVGRLSQAGVVRYALRRLAENL